MRITIIDMMFSWFLFGAWCSPVHADGGTLLLSEERGGYKTSVFSAPTPFRSGAVDISVLVQEASTGAPMPHVPVTIRMSQAGRRPLEYPATVEAATNKLFRAAQFELPASGLWKLQAQVDGKNGPVTIIRNIVAAEPLPRWQEMWLWFTWPALPIVLFMTYRVLARPTSAHDGNHSYV